MKARHRKSSPRAARALVGIGAALVSTVAVVGGTAGAASADITRCVGAVQTPGAFACYTSPRFDSSGFERTNIASFPIVCYGVGCTGSVLWGYVPDDYVNGRFTTIYYLGHTYTVYRPAASQPYILTSDNPRLDEATTVEVLALSTALDAANGL